MQIKFSVSSNFISYSVLNYCGATTQLCGRQSLPVLTDQLMQENLIQIQIYSVDTTIWSEKFQTQLLKNVKSSKQNTNYNIL